MRRLVVLACLVLGLGACTPDLQLATSQPYTPEWCQAAKAFSNSGNYLYAVAQCHERGVAGFPQDPNLVNYYLSEAARRGHVEAGAQLASRGEPIPDDDLRREAVARTEAERNRQALLAATRPAPQPRNTSLIYPGGAPRITPPPLSGPPRIGAPTPVPSPGVQTSVTRENRTTNSRRVCTNNVCRTETTTCINGQCTTSVTQ